MKTNREVVRELFESLPNFVVIHHPAYCDDVSYSELVARGYMRCGRFGSVSLCETKLTEEQICEMTPAQIYKIHP